MNIMKTFPETLILVQGCPLVFIYCLTVSGAGEDCLLYRISVCRPARGLPVHKVQVLLVSNWLQVL